jgi:hypothetical protein
MTKSLLTCRELCETIEYEYNNNDNHNRKFSNTTILTKSVILLPSKEGAVLPTPNVTNW